ncbi:MAG: HI0074 family nucleotidyltransferase substrate-binding subunit [bacterium]
MKTAELYQQLSKASLKMQEALTFTESEPYKESTIQRFEYTFELSWKLMNSILKDQLIDCYGIKNIFREAIKLGIIENIDHWFDYALNRNLTSHIYKEEIANQVYAVAKGSFTTDVLKLLELSKNYLE